MIDRSTSPTARIIEVAFDETLALEDQTFAGLLARDDCALYDEYLSGFDDIPVLLDLVALPPPRIVPPEFRLGERKDVRKHSREDAETRRESKARELEEMYREYAAPAAKKPTAKRKRKRQRQRRKKK
jgi:hypothetical protein